MATGKGTLGWKFTTAYTRELKMCCAGLFLQERAKISRPALVFMSLALPLVPQDPNAQLMASSIFKEVSCPAGGQSIRLEG